MKWAATIILCVSLVYASQDILVGAYYFDGWSGTRADSALWAKSMPSHVSYKLKNDFSEREPVWGWRNDSLEIMERQIELASQNGIDFFVFCWYWQDDQGQFNEQNVNHRPEHTSLKLFLNARNRNKMKFSILVCNHQGSVIKGKKNWETLIEYLSKTYFDDEQYLKIDGRPVVSFFSPKPAAKYMTDMRKKAKDIGLNGLYTVSCELSDFSGDFDVHSFYNILDTEPGFSKEFSYEKLSTFSEKYWYLCKKKHKDREIAPVVMAGWDRRPWQAKDDKQYYSKATPALFKRHLKNAVKFLDDSGAKSGLIFIYAWNELGEGGYLVPTKGDPQASLLAKIKEMKNEI